MPLRDGASLKTLLLVAFLTLGFCGTVQAKTYALLVGASSYRNLPPSKSLRAPANDVRRMRAALLALGIRPEDMDVYADDVDGSKADPTMETILAAFEALPNRVSSDDQVVIYMSGHGAQIPDDDGDEEDGFDEAFLPVDAVPPPPGAVRFDMTNVIRDDRIGQLLDALRGRGAHVWLVVDSCHSGTISRAATEEARAKEISAADFGLPVAQAAARSPGVAPGFTRNRRAEGGSLAAFYASQSDEISLELAVPRGAPPDRQTWVSAFTDSMLAVLQRGGVATYRELMTESARVMRSQIPPRTRQTPGFDGDAMDRPLLGGGAAERPPGFAVDSDRVAGGLLAGLESGTVVALFERLDDAEPFAYAQVTQADPLMARVTPIAYPCAQQQGVPQCQPRADATVLERARVARVAVPVTRVHLRISPPRDWPGRVRPKDRSEIEKVALEQIRADSGFTIDDGSPDFVWYRTPDGARFVPSWIPAADEEFGPSAALDAVPATEAVSRLLGALHRARMLMRLERIRMSLPSNALPIGVATAKTTLMRYARDASGRCRFTATPASLDQTASVTTCDGASVQIDNGGTTPVFAYVFALDDGWNLHPLNNACRQGAQNRIDVGGTRTVSLRYQSGTIDAGLAPRTRNGVLVFAVPFEPGVPLAVDPCQFVRSMMAADTRADSSNDPIEAMLAGRTGTRGDGRASSLGQLVMSVETWPVEQGLRP